VNAAVLADDSRRYRGALLVRMSKLSAEFTEMNRKL
jgi:hypothetical protein